MRILAEEKRSRTDQLILTAPVSVTGVVLGKFLALLTIFLIPVAITCTFPLIMCQFGTVPLGEAYVAILAYFLYGASMIAIGIFISSLTESQIIAAVLGFGVLLVLYLMNGFAAIIPATAIASFISLILVSALLALLVYGLTKNFNVAVIVAACCVIPLCVVYMIRASLFSGLFPAILSYLAVFDRFYTFAYGILDVTAIVYYLTVIVFFLFLTVQVMEKKRWS
jgi:ABC-2 type transport system permease protein